MSDDRIPTADDLNHWTTDKLKDMRRKRNLRISGSKTELVESRKVSHQVFNRSTLLND